MELPLHVPLMIIPAVSLLYLSYSSRFLALAQLVRSLHKEYEEGGDTVVLRQIASLRRRLRLIIWMQASGALSFVAAAVSTTCIFFGAATAGHVSFGVSLVFIIASVLVLLLEIRVSTHALSLLLEESEMRSRGARPS